MLSRRTMRRPSTGVFQIAVWTVLPCQVTSRGRPTFTESKRPIAIPIGSRCYRADVTHTFPFDLRKRQVTSMYEWSARYSTFRPASILTRFSQTCSHIFEADNRVHGTV